MMGSRVIEGPDTEKAVTQRSNISSVFRGKDMMGSRVIEGPDTEAVTQRSNVS